MAASNYLSLDDASAQLQVSRRQLSSAAASLGLKTTRGTDRRAYLSSSDVERIRAFRGGEESKTNPIYQGSILYASAPQPQEMPRTYKSFAKEGYAGDPTFFKAASYIITNGAAIPPKLYIDASLKKEIEKHPLLDKLETPNNEQSGVDYREAAIGSLLIAGNTFQYASRVTNKSGPPDELWVLPPDQVHPVTQKPRGVTGYKFDAWEDQAPPIAPELIRHDKFWNPDGSSVFGLSPVEPAAIMIDMNLAARKWNLSVLQNGGRMDGAWVAPVPMAPNERKTMRDNLKNQYRGYQNAGEAPVLDADLKWQPTGYTPTEMDWLESIRRNEAGIANVVNIPPQLIGDTSASTYDNMDAAKGASYTEEIFPVLDRIYAGWRRWLLPMYGLAGAYLYYDKTSVEVVQKMIQAQKEAEFKRAVSGWMSGFLTMNEARAMAGLAPIPGGDVYRFGAILVRSSELDKYAEQSLTKPAAPPMPAPEPLDGPPAPDGKEPKPAPQKRVALTSVGKSRLPEVKRKLQGRGKAANSGEVTHIGPWECAAGACAFCLENDGATVAVGEDFPNGCSSPDDCHNFCKCQAYELSLPDGTNPDDFESDTLVYFFAVGFIASRHDKDVAAQQQADEEDDDEGDYADPEYAKARARAERQKRREEYQRFMEAVL